MTHPEGVTDPVVPAPVKEVVPPVVVAEAPVVTPDPAPVVPAPVVTAPVEPVTADGKTIPTLEAELAAGLTRMQGMEAEIGRIQGTSRDAQAEREKVLLQLTGEITKRDQLQGQLDSLSSKLTEASQATQKVVSERDKAELDAVQATQKAASAESRAVKLETLTAEFPDLIPYAEFIVASEDPAVVRAACEKLRATRSKDLEGYSQTLGAGYAMQTVPTRGMERVADVGNPAELEGYLADAFSNPAEFQARIEKAKQSYATSIRRT